jgi:hypothetical protein
VLRAGYGWFYQRFTVPNSFGSNAGTPYVIQAIHQNGINQKVSTITDPTFPVNPDCGSTSNTAQTLYTIDPHFHAAPTCRRPWASIVSWPRGSPRM